MVTAYLSLGSNLGDRVGRLWEAIARISGTGIEKFDMPTLPRLHSSSAAREGWGNDGVGRVIAVSSFYETEPVEVTDQPWFVNCVVAVETELGPEELMLRLLAIEREMGRERREKKGPRVIDIDILFYGDAVVETSVVSIPHPAMGERRFVLEPLAEIAGDARYPGSGKTVREMLGQVGAGQVVRKIGR